MTPPRTPLSDTVLLVDDQEWTSRSVESILRPRGFAVLKAYTGRQALDLASRVSPDLIVVDFHLPDMDGIDVVRELRSRQVLDPVTPLLMLSSTAAGRAERLEALGAGAWDILRHPLDAGELVLRLENLLSAKKEADRLRQEIITDPSTGFYNVRGVLRRVRELGADSLRFGRPMACIVVGPEWQEEAPARASDPFATSVAQALRAVVRESDTVGRLGPEEFVVVLSGVDGEAAAQLADRILEQAAVRGVASEGTDPAATAEMPHRDLRLRAGVFVTGTESALDPERLLSKATLALRRAQAGEGSFRIQSFDA